MSLFAILHSGASALAAQGRALQTTSNNVANAETPGYARQRTELSTRGTLRRSGLLLGQGVSAKTVTSAYDRFSQAQVYSRLGDEGFAGSRATTMRGLEVALGEGEDGAIGQRLSEFFDAFSALEATPGSPAVRLEVLGKAGLFATAVNRGADALQYQADEANQAIADHAGEVNELGARIAALNANIVQLEAAGADANDLRVQRTQAVEALAGLAEVRASEQPDGTVNVLFAGHHLVEGDTARSVTTATDATTGLYEVRISHGTTSLDITSGIGSRGRLGAAITTRDQTIPGLMNDLDALAFGVASQVNTVHRTGFGLDGSTGADFFAAPTQQAGAAAALTVDVALAGNPDGIAASGSASTLPGGNTNAAQLAALADSLTMAGGTRTFSTFHGEMLAELGGMASTAYAEESRAGMQLSAALDARDAKTAVSLEEEAIDLIRFQEAYQAAARVVSTANDLFDELLAIV